MKSKFAFLRNKTLYFPISLWLQAGVLAFIGARLLDWLTNRFLPSAIEDLSTRVIWKLQIPLGPIIFLSLIIAVWLDKRFLCALAVSGANKTMGQPLEAHSNTPGLLLPIDLLMNSIGTKNRRHVLLVLVMGLALHILFVIYLTRYGHEVFITSLDLLIGGPGPVILIEPFLRATNCFFIFFALIQTYIWSPVLVSHLDSKTGHITPSQTAGPTLGSLIVTVLRLGMFALIIWLFDFTILKSNHLSMSLPIIFTMVFVLLATISAIPYLVWKMTRPPITPLT